MLKNELEDLAFFYIYPEEYKKIDNFLKENEQSMQLSFNNFITVTKNLLEKNGLKRKKYQNLFKNKTSLFYLSKDAKKRYYNRGST